MEPIFKEYKENSVQDALYYGLINECFLGKKIKYLLTLKENEKNIEVFIKKNLQEAKNLKLIEFLKNSVHLLCEIIEKKEDSLLLKF